MPPLDIIHLFHVVLNWTVILKRMAVFLLVLNNYVCLQHNLKLSEMSEDTFYKTPQGMPKIWRKLGPIGWVQVIGTWFDSDPWKNDKASQGVMIKVSDVKHTRKGMKLVWSKQTYFMPCKSIPQFIKMMRDDYHFLPKELRRKDMKRAFKSQVGQQ